MSCWGVGDCRWKMPRIRFIDGDFLNELRRLRLRHPDVGTFDETIRLYHSKSKSIHCRPLLGICSEIIPIHYSYVRSNVTCRFRRSLSGGRGIRSGRGAIVSPTIGPIDDAMQISFCGKRYLFLERFKGRSQLKPQERAVCRATFGIGRTFARDRERCPHRPNQWERGDVFAGGDVRPSRRGFSPARGAGPRAVENPRRRAGVSPRSVRRCGATRPVAV